MLARGVLSCPGFWQGSTPSLASPFPPLLPAQLSPTIPWLGWVPDHGSTGSSPPGAEAGLFCLSRAPCLGDLDQTILVCGFAVDTEVAEASDIPLSQALAAAGAA